MKNICSKLVFITSKNKGYSRVFSVSIRTLLGSVGFSTLLLMGACSSQSSSNTTNDNKVSLSKQTQQDAAEIEDNIKNSYARVASNHVDVCPKLLQQDIDSRLIERTAEVLVEDYCDYFLYPKIGEDIAVSLNNDQIEALLIVPTLHDFANGDYRVSAYDKHVIRLAYNGATYKPDRLNYDVVVSVID